MCRGYIIRLCQKKLNSTWEKYTFIPGMKRMRIESFFIKKFAKRNKTNI